jgi:hypothetical protein
LRPPLAAMPHRPPFPLRLATVRPVCASPRASLRCRGRASKRGILRLNASGLCGASRCRNAAKRQVKARQARRRICTSRAALHLGLSALPAASTHSGSGRTLVLSAAPCDWTPPDAYAPEPGFRAARGAASRASSRRASSSSAAVNPVHLQLRRHRHGHAAPTATRNPARSPRGTVCIRLPSSRP